MKNISFLTVALTLCLFLSACGVKPSSVEPPSGSKNTSFPRTYPATEK